MTFIVTRRSAKGEAKWVDVPSSEVGDLIAKDLLESGLVDAPAKTTEDRQLVARTVVALDGCILETPPFPETWSWRENTYTIEQTKDLAYPVELTPDDNGTVLATFPDLPGAVTFGENERDALVHAVDCLETMLLARILDRKDIPPPSPAQGRLMVRPTLLGALKVTVYRAMRERGWRKADLARALGLNPRQVDRLLDLRHASTVKQLEQALAACGKRADVLARELKAA
jgi:antitoxin HicB